MKTTGMIKQMDDLGRLVIPKEIRTTLGIDKEFVEFYIDGDALIVKKWTSHCVFCGETEGLIEYKDKLVCSNCRRDIAGSR